MLHAPVPFTATCEEVGRIRLTHKFVCLRGQMSVLLTELSVLVDKTSVILTELSVLVAEMFVLLTELSVLVAETFVLLARLSVRVVKVSALLTYHTEGSAEVSAQADETPHSI